MYEFSLGDLSLIRPHLTVFLFGLIVLIHDVWVRERSRVLSLSVTAAGLLVALAFNLALGGELDAPRLAFSGMLAVDGYSVFVNAALLISALGALLISHDYLARIDVRVLEFNPLLLFVVFGMMLLGASNDLIMLFVSLELMSVGVYVLVGMNRGEIRSVEGALKYFVLGAFASAILLYGVALIYGSVGTTRLDLIGEYLASGHSIGESPLLAVGFAMLLVGFGFKVAAVPFHMWSPDVYQGAPTPITSLMATGVKAASFAAFGRVLFVGFLAGKVDWVAALWALSALTILVGNVAALAQTDLKRMLAYSSIGHAGYLLMAFVAAPAEGLAANGRVAGLLFYLLAYTIMSVGAFAVVSLLTRDGRDDTAIDHLAGLAAREPLVAAGLTVCLLSLAGIPPTMGFVAKFYLFAAAVEGGHVGLAVVGAIGGAVGVYYYLRPIVLMYMRPADDNAVQPALNSPALGALAAASVALIVFGVWPGPLIDWARASLLSIAGM